LHTAGEPTAIKLTPITGPGGLLADGADVALFDVEVVDAKGMRCPTNESRVDFQMTGPGIWRGGYNSGIVGSTNNLHLLTECGINRVAIRSTLSPGIITLSASGDGLTAAKAEVKSVPANGGADQLAPAQPRRGLPTPLLP
jgi:beta-galactosidase